MSAPERIFGWMDSQLSVARFYGGCRFQGAEYVIAYHEEGKPLVRFDVVKRERLAERAKAKADKAAAKSAQDELL